MKKNLEQLFIEQINRCKNKKVLFWGASIFLENILKKYEFKNVEILGIIDMNNQRWNKKIDKYEIYPPEKMLELNPDLVIISIQNLDRNKNSEIVQRIKRIHSKTKIAKNILLKETNQEKWEKNAFLIKIFDRILPKKKNKCVFLSYPDFSDNTKEYYEYLIENHSDKYDLIWLYEKEENKNYEHITKKYHIKTLDAIWHMITARYLLFSHVHYTIEHLDLTKHILMALWHGMPLKTLGCVEKDIPEALKNKYKIFGQYGYFFATSDIFKLSMQNCFMMNYDRIITTGQPRTDCVLTDRNKINISNFLNLNKYDKVILYTPTYKEAIRNHKRDIDKSFQNIFYCDDYSESNFFKLLEEKNILFIIKPHPMDEIFYKKHLEKNYINNPHIKILYDQDMKENNFYFYDFFKFADLMITDFSSIGIDYLISKKPIIFLCPTKEEYNKKRGFILEDNHEILMPGEKVQSFNDLLVAVEDALTIDSWKEKRLKSIPLLHKYTDSNASERIYEIMKNLQ